MTVPDLPGERLGSTTDGPPAPHDAIDVLAPRLVPLGGPRSMTVRRTLPERGRRLIGAWCFADHYGPDDVSRSGGMDVAPHPHSGLQTISWLFEGEVEHRDSAGNHLLVRPGELNLMTGGAGIAHSEVSTPGTAILHGAQLWVALPSAHRQVPRGLQTYRPEPVPLPGGSARVFLGSLAGDTSRVPTFTPLLGAELTLHPGAEIHLQVDPGFEHGILVDQGDLRTNGTPTPPGHLAFVPAGRAGLTLTASGEQGARLLLLGGPPFDEQIVMWWNFVAGSHEEIVECHDQWQSESDRFGTVHGYSGAVPRLPAPDLPRVRLKARGSR